MKYLGVLLGLILSATAVEYSLHGGYKTSMKYVYQYEARLRPAQLPLLEKQFIELNFHATVELYPLSNEKFLLKISKHSFEALMSDPKYTDAPVRCDEILGKLEALERYIKLPMIFKYNKGLVKSVNGHKDDRTFSINLKKALVSLLHVEFQGKDPKTGRVDMFEKEELSVVGMCQTSYSVDEFKVLDGRRQWISLGFNVTKVIDMNRCSASDYEVYNKVIPGANENTDANPLRSSATIKYNILGEKGNFKIEEIHAVGTHVLYIASEEEGGINSVTEQRLKLIRTEKKKLKKTEFGGIEQTSKPLMMNVRSFGNLEFEPELTKKDGRNIAELVHTLLGRVMQLVPKPVSMEMEFHSRHLPVVSDLLFRMVDAVRKADHETHALIWRKCSKGKRMRRWTVFVFGLCGTQNGMKFMTQTLKTIPEEELIAEYLFSIGFAGKPSRKMVENHLKEIVEIETIKKSPELRKLAYVAAANMIKTYTKQKKSAEETWLEKVIKDSLSKIPTTCIKHRELCIIPGLNLPATVVLALAENLERPGLFPVLERIVVDANLPLEIRVKALLAIRPLVRVIRKQVLPLVLRIFRDRTCDTELRTVAFLVIMDAPSPGMIFYVAQFMRREPSMNIRRFVYDKFVAISRDHLDVTLRIRRATLVALQRYSKNMIPSRILSKSGCFHLNWFSKSWAVGASLRHEEIHKTNFLPNLINSRLNITVLGRKINVLEAQLRFEGLEDYLRKIIGPSGYLEKKHSIFDFLRSRRSVDSETLEEIKKQVPTFKVPDEKFKILSQLKLFGKIFHVEKTSIDSSSDLKDLFTSGSIIRAASLETELKKGKFHGTEKPFMPIEVIYRMPSLVGVTMTANLTSMVMPVSVSKLTAEVKPGLLTPKSLLFQQRDSVHVTAENKLSAIADIRGQIDFQLPGLRVGAKMRTHLNISTHLKARVDYNFKTRLFNTEFETPKQIKEILLVRRKASHVLVSEHGEIDSSSLNEKPVDARMKHTIVRSGGDRSTREEVRIGKRRRWSQDDIARITQEFEAAKKKWHENEEVYNVAKEEFLKIDPKERISNPGSKSAKHDDKVIKQFAEIVDSFDVIKKRYLAAKAEYEKMIKGTGTRTETRDRRGVDAENKPHKILMKELKPTNILATAAAPVSNTPIRRIPAVTRNEHRKPEASPSVAHHNELKTTASLKTPLEGIQTVGAPKATPVPHEKIQGTPTAEHIPQSSSISPGGSHPTPSEPLSTTIPESKQPRLGQIRPRRTKSLEIPIDIDQFGKLEVFGMPNRPDVSEDWVLKASGKFISIKGANVELSNTPTPFKVSFHGKNRRIVSFSTRDKKTVVMNARSGCLTVTDKPKHEHKLFVVTKTRSNTISIRSVVGMKPVPKGWGVARRDELQSIEKIQNIIGTSLFESQVGQPKGEEERKQKPENARLVHWSVKGNSVCLSPFAHQSIKVEIKKKTSLNEVLRRQTYKKESCVWSLTGLGTCLQGFHAYPHRNYLPSIYSPVEYRLRLKPSSKIEKLKFTLQMPGMTSKTQTYVAIMSVGAIEKLKITATYDVKEGTATLRAVPSDQKVARFPKLCMNFRLHPENFDFTVSFDAGCKQENLKVDLVHSRVHPRMWIALRMKYSRKGVPDYILKALELISTNVVLPALKSTAFVFSRPNPNKKYETMAKLKIQLPTDETARITLKTKDLTYQMDDIKLPRQVKTMPVGTKEISLLRKLSETFTKPRCLHKGNKFVTFDKKAYNFNLRGQCEHQLLRVCDQSSTNIAVLIRRKAKGQERIVTVLVDSMRVEIIPTTKLEDKPIVKINKKTITFREEHVEFIGTTKKPLLSIIWESETKTLIAKHHKFDLQVDVKESHIVSVKISPFFTNKTCGLCGDSDGEQFKDFMTPEGTIVNDARRRTLAYPKLINSAETIFASSWIVPEKECNAACPFTRRFHQLKPNKVPGKTCLSNYRITQCAPKCKTTGRPERTRIPMTCVPEPQVPQLKAYLSKGKTMDLSKAQGFLADVDVPIDCQCHC